MNFHDSVLNKFANATATQVSSLTFVVVVILDLAVGN